MISPFLRGARCLLTGLSLLGHERLRSFVLLPLVINLLLFGGGLWWGGSELSAWLDAQIAKLPDWLHWLHWLLVPLLVAAAALVTFYGFSIVANLVGAPFNGWLAERAEALFDPSVQVPERPLWQEVTIAFASALRATLYFLLRAIPQSDMVSAMVWFTVPPVIGIRWNRWTAHLPWRGPTPSSSHKFGPLVSDEANGTFARRIVIHSRRLTPALDGMMTMRVPNVFKKLRLFSYCCDRMSAVLVTGVVRR